MSKLLSITLPDRIHAALCKAGAELEQGPAEFLRTHLIIATKEHGAALRLKLEPLPPGDLPLFDAAEAKHQEQEQGQD